VCKLPVERTEETGYEVNQSCDKGGALVPLALNDASSVVQHDDTDCKQFESAAEEGLSEPRNDVCVESIVQHENTDCKQFESAAEQGLSVPRNEVNSNTFSTLSPQNVTGVNSAVSLYSEPV